MSAYRSSYRCLISRLRRTLVIAMVLLLLLVGVPFTQAVPGIAASVEPAYTPTTIPFTPYAINNAGQVVGGKSINGGQEHAYLWQNGTVTDLGTLGGANNFYAQSSVAFGINNTGQVVGTAPTPSGFSHAFLWQNGTMTDLGTFGGSSSKAHGINDTGQIVGEAQTLDGVWHAFLWQRGTMTDLGAGAAYGINASGRIVGQSADQYPVMWQNGIRTNVDTRRGYAFGINDVGHIVGQVTLPEASTQIAKLAAFVYRNGGVTLLPDLGGDAMARGINNAGDIVGWASPQRDRGDGSRAVIYSDDKMVELAPRVGSGTRFLEAAVAINKYGQIVGNSGYLLSPPGIAPPTTESIQLSPNTALLAVGARHTVSVAILDDLGRPVQNRAVTFSVTAGPDSGSIGTVATGPDGVASASFVNRARGRDTIVASFTGAGGSAVVSAPASATFSGPLTLVDFSASGHYDPASGTYNANTRQSPMLYARVRDELGNPVAGVSVAFEVLDGPDKGHTFQAQTAATGVATSYAVSRGGPGTDTIVARVTGPDGRVSSRNVAIAFEVVVPRFTEEQKAQLETYATLTDQYLLVMAVSDVYDYMATIALAEPVILPEFLITLAATKASEETIKFAAEQLHKLAEDPADPEFRAIAQPVVHILPSQPIQPGPNLTPRFAAANNALMTNNEQASALAEAAWVSINRAQGARNAGDTAWEARQLAAAKGYSGQLAPLLAAQPALRAEVLAATREAGLSRTITAAQVAQAQDYVARNGLPAPMRQAYSDLGADAAMLQLIEYKFLAVDPAAIIAVSGGDALAALTAPALDAPAQQVAAAMRTFEGPISAPDFADVPADYWAHDQIGRFAQRGITTGCGTDEQGRRVFCPERGVTRAEMATFLTRTLGQDKAAPPTTPTFADVPADYWAYGQIEAFAKLGITTGCGVNDRGQRIFCPDRGVTRAEMAAFLDRAKGQAELPSGSPTFADVPTGYWAYGWIERFFTLGVTTGCGTDERGSKVYCPDRGVTRAEMAVFIIRAYP